MVFENIIGQTRTKNALRKAIENDRLSHAYLFSGLEGVGCDAMAVELGKQLLSTGDEDVRLNKLTHPDFHVIFPSPAKLKEDEYRDIVKSFAENPYTRQQPWANPSISIGKVREIRRKASFKSFEGKGRVVLILDCERMTVEAANALLKILEEPPDKMYLIMTSEKPNLLLPTIKSRCQAIKLDPIPVGEIETALSKLPEMNAEKIKLAARLSAGSYKMALELLGEDLSERQNQALEFFRKTIQNSFLQTLFVDELLNRFNRDLKSVKELLAHVAIWFRDALIFREGGETVESSIIHFTEKEILSNFNKTFPEADLHAAVQEIENSIALMDRNVQINLILIVLLNKLRVFVRR